MFILLKKMPVIDISNMNLKLHPDYSRLWSERSQTKQQKQLRERRIRGGEK